MSEILFKGKRADTGEWVKGDLIQLYDGRKFIIDNKFGACIDDKGNFINTESPFVCEIIPETVGRYTGLTDKNGEKIFEGDILEVDIREYEKVPDDWIFGSYSKKVYTGRKIKALWSVEYKEHRCRGNGFYVYGKDRRFNTTLTQSTIFNSNPVVIGNIHDNLELMKKK